MVSSYVDEARAVVAGSGGVDAFVLREAWVLRMTGVYAGGGYIVMGCLWMVVGVQLAGGWQRQRAFVIAGRSAVSAIPRGKPLKPVLRISRSGPTTTQPTWVDGSLLHAAMCAASAKKRRSHLRLIRPRRVARS